MKKFLIGILLLLLLSPSRALAVDLSTTTCPGSGCVDFIVSNNGSIGIQITGTWVGTITFQSTVGTSSVSSTFTSLLAFPSNAQTPVSTTTGNGIWTASVPGINLVRVVFTSYMSGTATVIAKLSNQAKGSGGSGSGGGTVTSVGLTAPSAVFDVANSPVTTSGSLDITFDTQSANRVFAGPTNGAAAAPTFRSVVLADLPSMTSSEFAGKISDETGTAGNLVFSGSPTISAAALTGVNTVTGALNVTANSGNAYWLTLYANPTNLVTEPVYAFSNYYELNPSASPTQTFYALDNETVLVGANTESHVAVQKIGIYNAIRQDGSGNAGYFLGGHNDLTQNGNGNAVEFEAGKNQINWAGNGTLSTAFVTYSLATNSGSGTIGNTYLNWAGVTKGAGATNTNLFAYWADNLMAGGTNPYAFWYDGGSGADCNDGGVTRINQFGIFAYYNPCFAKYTPGATNFERLILRFGDTGVFGADNRAYMGVEVGGTGTDRPVNLIGANYSITSTLTPAVTDTTANSCGTGTQTIVGNDNAGKVTVIGSAGTSCTVTFATAFTNAPSCSASNETSANLARATSTTTTVVLAGTFAQNDVIAYVCLGR